MDRIIEMTVVITTSLLDDKIRDIMADFVDKLAATDDIKEITSDSFEEVNN